MGGVEGGRFEDRKVRREEGWELGGERERERER